MKTERPFVMEAWPAGTRARALRHALRYRVRARQLRRAYAYVVQGPYRQARADLRAIAVALGAYDDSDLVSLATTLRARVAALEGAAGEALRHLGDGALEDARAVLRRVSDG